MILIVGVLVLLFVLIVGAMIAVTGLDSEVGRRWRSR